MLIPLAIVCGLVLTSAVFSAISLFTYGWATMVIPYDFYSGEEILLGLVPFDDNSPGWLIATSIFMYLNFTCIILCFLLALFGLLLFIFIGNPKFQKFIFVALAAFTFLTGLFGAIAFVLFAANYDNDDYDVGSGYQIYIGYSPFLDLIGFVIAIIATGVSAFFAISLLNSDVD